jgi:hypothetical protein
MAGRPKRDVEVKGVYIRISPALVKRVEHCQWLLQRQHGPRVTVNDAFWQIIEAGCAVLEGRLEGSETPAPGQAPIAEIAQISLSKISEISGDDVSVPGYGFPEDEDEILAPASPMNGQGAPAPQPPTQPAIPLALEPAPTPVQSGDVPQTAETLTPRARRPASHALPHETLQAIADERTHCEGLSLREFAQRLFDKDIYQAKAKDGSRVPANPGNVKKWLEQARHAGVL